LILSKLFYGGSIWIPSASKSELREAQVIHNQVMRFVCGNQIVKQEELLKQTGFPSVRQYGVYQVVMLGLKVGWEGKPLNLHDQLIQERKQFNNHVWRQAEVTRVYQSERTFRHQFLSVRRLLPPSFFLQHPNKIKKALKKWVRESIPSSMDQVDTGIVPAV